LLLREVSVTGIQNLSGLKKLEVFHFNLTGYNRNEFWEECRNLLDDTYRWIYSWCAQNLPKVKKIDNFFGCRPIKRRSFTPAFVGTSHLEHFESTHFLPDACLPNLKTLVLGGNINYISNFRKLSSYKNLTSLQLIKLKMEDI